MQALDLCRLCFSSNTKLTNSIDDDAVLKFLDLIPIIVLSDDPSLPVKVCQLCYSKVKIATDFINGIKESQKSFATSDRRKTRFKEKVSAPKYVIPVNINDVLAKMQQKSGLSFKKVRQNDPISVPDEKPNISLINDEDWNNSNQEKIGELCCDESVASSEDVFGLEESEEADSDEDLKPSSNKASTSKGVGKSKSIYIDAPITFTCAKCKSTFKDFCSLSTHMKNRNCFVEEIKCKICDKEFQTKRSLYTHIRSHRPKPPKIMCDSCGMDFSSTFDLDTHMESSHQRAIKRDCIFRCTHCEESFTSHLDLLEHVKQHSKDKKDSPKLCEVCARECPNQKSYQAHMQHHRTDRRTYKCDTCNKGFIKSYQLVQHMHVHTGVKSFICDVCDRSYAKRDSLRLHKKKEHPE